MKNIILILFLIMNLSSQTYTQNLGYKLHDAHANFIEKTITKRRFGYKILVNKIVGEYKQAMAKKGLDGYKVGGSDQKNKVDDNTLDEAVKRIVEKKNKSKK